GARAPRDPDDERRHSVRADTTDAARSVYDRHMQAAGSAAQRPPRAALFDMDRTLVRKETASLYVRYQIERGEASWADLARTLYWVGQYTLGILDAQRVAERALRGLRGKSEREIEARCEEWFTRYVEQHIADSGRLAVRRHREAGDLCAIVTGASPYAA